MPTLTADEASAILRGHRGTTTVDQCRAAGAALIAERQKLLLIAIWAERLLNAADNDAAERARRRLADALAQWP